MKQMKLPGDVGPHALSVLRLFPPVSRKGGAGRQTQTKEETLPGDVGLHALRVLWLFPL